MLIHERLTVFLIDQKCIHWGVRKKQKLLMDVATSHTRTNCWFKQCDAKWLFTSNQMAFIQTNQWNNQVWLRKALLPTGVYHSNWLYSKSKIASFIVVKKIRSWFDCKNSEKDILEKEFEKRWKLFENVKLWANS